MAAIQIHRNKLHSLVKTCSPAVGGDLPKGKSSWCVLKFHFTNPEEQVDKDIDCATKYPEFYKLATSIKEGLQ